MFVSMRMCAYAHKTQDALHDVPGFIFGTNLSLLIPNVFICLVNINYNNIDQANDTKHTTNIFVYLFMQLLSRRSCWTGNMHGLQRYACAYACERYE